MGVAGWPELARCGASMARPRMTLMARCSRSSWLTVSPYPGVPGPKEGLRPGEKGRRRRPAPARGAPGRGGRGGDRLEGERGHREQLLRGQIGVAEGEHRLGPVEVHR